MLFWWMQGMWGRYDVVPLLSAPALRLDVVIITHPHGDHMELKEVVERFL